MKRMIYSLKVTGVIEKGIIIISQGKMRICRKIFIRAKGTSRPLQHPNTCHSIFLMYIFKKICGLEEQPLRALDP